MWKNIVWNRKAKTLAEASVFQTIDTEDVILHQPREQVVA